MEQQGARATTIDAVISDSQAPRGSVYYYFKNGRTDMIKAAMGVADDQMMEMIHQSFTGQKDLPAAVEAFFDNWGAYVSKNDFKNGCMATALAVEGHSLEEDLQQLDRQTFTQWQDELVKSITAYGLAAKQAQSLATMILASGEGAVILSRVSHSLLPMQQVAHQVSSLAQKSTQAK